MIDDAKSPRVPNNFSKEQESTRATRVPAKNASAARVPVTISDARDCFKVGTKISKKFVGISYKGKVIKPYDGRHYLIEYKDGDKEHMTHIEVPNNLPRTPFTGGYAAALESILTKNADMNAIALDNLREVQDVAFAVTHPITDKQMEYKDLIKDPEFRDDWLLSKSNKLGRLLQGGGKKQRWHATNRRIRLL